MINGHFSALLDEARSHWQHILSAAGVVRQALPMMEWVKIAVVAVVTAVLTSQVTIARLDERIVSSLKEREILVKRRDEQVRELKDRDQRIEDRLEGIATDVAILKARVK